MFGRKKKSSTSLGSAKAIGYNLLIIIIIIIYLNINRGLIIHYENILKISLICF
jgi:hypothetical protein